MCTKEACQFNDNLAGFQAAGVPVIGISPDDSASHGDTQEEALANLWEALELYFEDSPVPEVDVNPELASVDVHIPA